MYHRFDVSTPRLWLLIQDIQCMQGIQQAHKQEWHSLHDVDANTANISMLAGPSMEHTSSLYRAATDGADHM